MAKRATLASPYEAVHALSPGEHERLGSLLAREYAAWETARLRLGQILWLAHPVSAAVRCVGALLFDIQLRLADHAERERAGVHHVIRTPWACRWYFGDLLERSRGRCRRGKLQHVEPSPAFAEWRVTPRQTFLHNHRRLEAKGTPKFLTQGQREILETIGLSLRLEGLPQLRALHPARYDDVFLEQAAGRLDRLMEEWTTLIRDVPGEA